MRLLLVNANILSPEFCSGCLSAKHSCSSLVCSKGFPGTEWPREASFPALHKGLISLCHVATPTALEVQ